MVIGVAILGATGVVGRKAYRLLQNHPMFRVDEVCSRNAVQKSMYDNCSVMPIIHFEDLKSEFILSCLPTDAAPSIEIALAERGKIVFSNASCFRMEPNIPLLIPEINSRHLALLDQQKTPGKIIKNPNCSAVGIALALAPLMHLSEIQHVSAITMQSISGAGYSGVASMDILGNTIPHIEGEREKISQETKKILGSSTRPANFCITVHVHRIPVMYGHSATLHIKFKSIVSADMARMSYADWNKHHKELFVLHAQEDRPQCLKDLLDDDMRVHIGALRTGEDPTILGLNVLTHNLVRGAAGIAIANMESYLKHKERRAM